MNIHTRVVVTLLCFSLALSLLPCIAGNPRVMCRQVPERYDDFVFENNLVAGRIYGRALENCGKGQITSPGIDVWVKTPGDLIADRRYKDDLECGRSYHKNWGDGKDCYKVGKSLGAGASSPIADGKLCLPATNYRTWEILKETNNEVVFLVRYPEWTIPGGVKVALEKTFTVIPDTYFIKVEDVYYFTGARTITIGAGVNRHVKEKTMVTEEFGLDRYMLWEHASDTSAEPEEGMLGISVIMPECDKVLLTKDGTHAVCCKEVHSGETLTYWFGSCWTGGTIKNYLSWKAETENALNRFGKNVRTRQGEKKKTDTDKFSVRLSIGGTPEITGDFFRRGYAIGFYDYSYYDNYHLANMYSDYDGEVKTVGNILGEFNWNVNRWFNTGCTLGFCPVWSSTYDGITNQLKGDKFAMAIFLMPKAKIMWCNRPVVRVYSSISAGAAFLPGFTKSKTSVKAAGQFNLISLEVGRKWFGTMEIGAGSLYYGAQVGFGYKF